YWNATRAFMILSTMTCFAGIIAGILSFAHFSAFERFNRSFAAGIMFFVSSIFYMCAYRMHESRRMRNRARVPKAMPIAFLFCIQDILGRRLYRIKIKRR
ncbi:hypothetical protein GOODEAATRI_020513, partial [Goodea atripinnis]